MILSDRVTVKRREQTGEDDYGLPIYDDVETIYPAEVRPLSSTETVAAGQQVTTRFRVFLPPSAVDVTPSDALRWRERDYEAEGSVEPHLARGRLHHFEAVMKRVTG